MLIIPTTTSIAFYESFDIPPLTNIACQNNSLGVFAVVELKLEVYRAVALRHGNQV